jgi:hypothetical protein
MSICITDLHFHHQVPLCTKHASKRVAETLHSDVHRTKVEKWPTKLVPQASPQSRNPSTEKRTLSTSEGPSKYN